MRVNILTVLPRMRQDGFFVCTRRQSGEWDQNRSHGRKVAVHPPRRPMLHWLLCILIPLLTPFASAFA